MNRIETTSNEPQASDQKNPYYDEARSWETSHIAMIERSERRAWRVAVVSLVLVTAAVVALAALAPLKIAVPYIIYVDKLTGDTQVREAATAPAMQYSDIMDKHWLVLYVMSRERYYWEFLQSDYDRTMALSATVPGREYNRQFDGANALYKRLGRDQEYSVRVISVGLTPHTPGTPGTAVVRFEKTLRKINEDQPGATGHYIATIAYEYNISSFSSERRLIANPLGFTVTAYRVDPELVDATASVGNPTKTIPSPGITGSSVAAASASAMGSSGLATPNLTDVERRGQK